MVTNGVCDNYDCYQGNEFELKAYGRTSAGSLFTDRIIRIEGVPSTGYTPGLGRIQLFAKVNGDGRRIEIEFWETDYGPDDYYGTVTLRYPSDNGAALSPPFSESVIGIWNWTP